MKVVYSDSLVNTPARALLGQDTILLNAKVWDTLPEPYQKFILAHEEGHLAMKTTSELIADNYAFNKLAGQYPESLKSMVNTVAEILSESNNHRMRVKNIYRLALEWDVRNGNGSAKNELARITKELFNEYKNHPQFIYYKTVLMTNGYDLETYDWKSPEEALFQPKIGKTFINVSPTGQTQKATIEKPEFLEKFVSPIREQMKQTQLTMAYAKAKSQPVAQTEPLLLGKEPEMQKNTQKVNPEIFPEAIFKSKDYKLYALIALVVIAFFILIKM